MRVSLVGDLCLGEHYFNFGDGVGSFILAGGDPFEYVEKQVKDTDLLIGNLECVVGNLPFNNKDPRERVFRANDSALGVFSRFPNTILNVANNHSLEHGLANFHDMVRACRDRGLIICGLESEHGVAIQSIQGNIIAVVGASLVPDPRRRSGTESYYQPSIDELCKNLAELSPICDLLVLNIHWGTEDSLNATAEQKNLAELFLKAGTDVIVGHHPHVLYEVEARAEALICYSLGDFIFDLTWNKYIDKSAIVQFEFLNKAVENIKISGVHISKQGIPISTVKEVSVNARTSVNFYGFKGEMPNLLIGKARYMALNLFRGDVAVKFRFLLWKIKEKLFR